MEIREILPERFKDFNLIEGKAFYITTLKIANQKAREKDLLTCFFAKSINVNYM